jgi:hypothetical protein
MSTAQGSTHQIRTGNRRARLGVPLRQWAEVQFWQERERA